MQGKTFIFNFWHKAMFFYHENIDNSRKKEHQIMKILTIQTRFAGHEPFHTPFPGHETFDTHVPCHETF